MSRNNAKISLAYTDASLAATSALALLADGMLDGTFILTVEGNLWQLRTASGTPEKVQIMDAQDVSALLAARSGIATIPGAVPGPAASFVDVAIPGISATAKVQLTYAQPALDGTANGPLTYTVPAPGTLRIQSTAPATAATHVAYFVSALA